MAPVANRWRRLLLRVLCAVAAAEEELLRPQAAAVGKGKFLKPVLRPSASCQHGEVRTGANQHCAWTVCLTCQAKVRMPLVPVELEAAWNAGSMPLRTRAPGTPDVPGRQPGRGGAEGTEPAPTPARAAGSPPAEPVPTPAPAPAPAPPAESVPEPTAEPSPTQAGSEGSPPPGPVPTPAVAPARVPASSSPPVPGFQEGAAPAAWDWWAAWGSTPEFQEPTPSTTWVFVQWGCL